MTGELKGNVICVPGENAFFFLLQLETYSGTELITMEKAGTQGIVPVTRRSEVSESVLYSVTGELGGLAAIASSDTAKAVYSRSWQAVEQVRWKIIAGTSRPSSCAHRIEAPAKKRTLGLPHKRTTSEPLPFPVT